MREDLNSLTATVHYNNSFVGCGVFYEHAGEMFAITAGHNFYGITFSEVRELEKFVIYSVKNSPFKVTQIIGDITFAKQYDLIALKIQPEDINTQHSFKSPILKIGSANNNSYLVNTNNLDNCYTNLLNIKYDVTLPTIPEWFYVDVDGKYLSDSYGRYGPLALDGISGSGMFIDKLDKEADRILIGIVIEVPKDKKKNKFTCACVSILKHLLPGLDVLPYENTSDIDIGLLLDRMENEYTDKAIKDWIQKEKSSERIQFLNKKTEMIYPPQRIEQEKVRIIRNFLQGKVLLHEKVEKDGIAKRNYNQANRAFSGRSDLYNYISNLHEGKEKLDTLNIMYEKILGPLLDSHLNDAEITILANYTIADCITNCTIDFVKK